MTVTVRVEARRETDESYTVWMADADFTEGDLLAELTADHPFDGITDVIAYEVVHERDDDDEPGGPG